MLKLGTPKYVIDFNAEKHSYKLDGTRYPSVTTILDVIGKPQLIAWLKKHPEEWINKESKKALSIGHYVHESVEAMISGQPIPTPPPEHADKIRAGIDAFIQFRAEHPFEPIAVEVAVGSMALGYCGKFDILADRNGRITLMDWKTSGGVYWEYCLQLMAYQMALQEMYGIEVQDKWLVRLDKDTGKPHLYEVGKMPGETDKELWDTFLAALKLFSSKKVWEKGGRR